MKVAEFLHDTGTIVWIVSNSSDLGMAKLDVEEMVIMDAQFIVDLLSSIVTFSHNFVAKGWFFRNKRHFHFWSNISFIL